MDNQPTSAVFRIKSYRFTKARLNFEALCDCSLEISFNPAGEYSADEGEFVLFLTTRVTADQKEVLEVYCQVVYQFDSPMTFQDIPDYFYPNCLAIIFPYIRSFIGTLSLQANISPIVLPIINLTQLGSNLKENTLEKK